MCTGRRDHLNFLQHETIVMRNELYNLPPPRTTRPRKLFSSLYLPFLDELLRSCALWLRASALSASPRSSLNLQQKKMNIVKNALIVICCISSRQEQIHLPKAFFQQVSSILFAPLCALVGRKSLSLPTQIKQISSTCYQNKFAF